MRGDKDQVSRLLEAVDYWLMRSRELERQRNEYRDQAEAAEAALLNTQDQLKAAEARIAFLKSWNYGLMYGAGPATTIKVFGGKGKGHSQYVPPAEVKVTFDFAMAELRAAGLLVEPPARRFLWGE